MFKIIPFLHWIHSSLWQLYMYFWISMHREVLIIHKDVPGILMIQPDFFYRYNLHTKCSFSTCSRPVSISYYGSSNWNFVCRSCKMWMSCLTERSYRPPLMQGGQTVSTPGSLCSAPLKRRTIHSSSSPCPKEALMV